ncbi:RNA ligase family protein [Streptomyces sp. NBC_01565]|uniref:RNA ligase family protein n=1 Tax=unclassified Streptomyces TaxID=2593676 RepID=UPI00225A38AB|nr:RNA ligase family protein [Streptomyces sp. NBC_01565]MCX4545618.1 hypothetical protein [Streptomyces sp. NBC_01565]
MHDESDTRPWSPYPKIPAGRRLGETGGREWVAQEKIHGANFAVVCDGSGPHPAKRRELLGDGGLDEFFGVGRIWPALAVTASRCAALLRERYGAPGAAVVTVYGELAGGRYPHPGIPPVPGAEPVQTGVWYAPDLLWLPFDATVATAEGLCWVSDRALRTAAEAAGLRCAPLLAQGSLAEVGRLPVEFPTRLPGLLGLPALADNQAEGIVVKPAGESWSEAPPMAKLKQPAFAEDERFAGSRPYRAPAEGAAGVPGWLLAHAAGLLTPARAAAAVSKLGPRTGEAEIAVEIARDAADETEDSLGGLPPNTRSSLESALHPGALTLARFDAADRRA